jgi:hypothetical protein
MCLTVQLCVQAPREEPILLRARDINPESEDFSSRASPACHERLFSCDPDIARDWFMARSRASPGCRLIQFLGFPAIPSGFLQLRAISVTGNF